MRSIRRRAPRRRVPTLERGHDHPTLQRRLLGLRRCARACLVQHHPTDQFHHVPTALSAVSGECPDARCGRVLGARNPGTPTAQHLTGDVPTRRLHIIGAYARHPSLGTTDSTPWSAETMRHRCFTFR